MRIGLVAIYFDMFEILFRQVQRFQMNVIIIGSWTPMVLSNFAKYFLKCYKLQKLTNQMSITLEEPIINRVILLTLYSFFISQFL